MKQNFEQTIAVLSLTNWKEVAIVPCCVLESWLADQALLDAWGPSSAQHTWHQNPWALVGSRVSPSSLLTNAASSLPWQPMPCTHPLHNTPCFPCKLSVPPPFSCTKPASHCFTLSPDSPRSLSQPQPMLSAPAWVFPSPAHAPSPCSQPQPGCSLPQSMLPAPARVLSPSLGVPTPAHAPSPSPCFQPSLGVPNTSLGAPCPSPCSQPQPVFLALAHAPCPSSCSKPQPVFSALTWVFLAPAHATSLGVPTPAHVPSPSTCSQPQPGCSHLQPVFPAPSQQSSEGVSSLT